MKKNKEIIIKEEPEIEIKDLSVESLIGQAIKNKVSVETMERLLAMRKELKQEFAKEQFDKAMANFQGECPVIEKKKPGGKTNYGTVAYYYAPLESIVSQVKGLIEKNGFSYAVQTQTLDQKVKVTCIVKHSAGHSESSDVEVPLGAGTKVMSAPQIVASALTFAKRYAFCNAFGILTGDEDNDGQINNLKKNEPETVLGPTEEITVEPKKQISDKAKIAHLCKVLNIDMDEFTSDEIKKLTGLEVIDQNYPEIINRLEIIIQDRKDNK